MTEHRDDRHDERPSEDVEDRAEALRDDIVEDDKPQPLPDDDQPGYPDPDDYPSPNHRPKSLFEHVKRYDAAMASANTTTDNEADVAEFLAGIDHHKHRIDAMKMCALMIEATGVEPTFWEPSAIGFGSFHERSPDGDVEERMAVGFVPDDGRLTVRLMDGVDRYRHHLARLGPHETDESSIVIDHFDAIDQRILRRLVTQAFHSRDGAFVERQDA